MYHTPNECDFDRPASMLLPLMGVRVVDAIPTRFGHVL